MEVKCKAEKSQEEREQSVLPSQALWSQPWRGPVMNGLLFSGAYIHETQGQV